MRGLCSRGVVRDLFGRGVISGRYGVAKQANNAMAFTKGVMEYLIPKDASAYLPT